LPDPRRKKLELPAESPCADSWLQRLRRPAGLHDDCIAGSIATSPLCSLSNSNGPKQEYSTPNRLAVASPGSGRSTRDDDDVTECSCSRGSWTSGRGRRRPDGPKQNKQLTKGRCRGGPPHGQSPSTRPHLGSHCCGVRSVRRHQVK